MPTLHTTYTDFTLIMRDLLSSGLSGIGVARAADHISAKTSRWQFLFLTGPDGDEKGAVCAACLKRAEVSFSRLPPGPRSSDQTGKTQMMTNGAGR